MTEKPQQISRVKPKHLPQLKGFQFIYKTLGNGRCLENSLAMHLYQNEEEAVKVKKKVNNHLADNWFFYKDKVGLPYIVKIGVGPTAEEVEIRNDEEMIEFLKSDKSLKAYSNYHELLAIANIFNMKINIFTYKPTEWYWSEVGPSSDFMSNSKMDPQNVPDMYLYHSFNNHYDLLVTIDSHKTNQAIIETLENDEDEKLLEDVSLENDGMKDVTEENVVISSKSFKCDKCQECFESESDLRKHELIHSKAEFDCNICGRCFKVEDDLVAHQKHFHEEENQIWHCNDCAYEANTQTKLNEHLKNANHTAKIDQRRKNYDHCYTCDLAVDGYWSLMNHRKDYHPSNKKCKNFENGICQFGVKCWYVHEEDLMETDESLNPQKFNIKCYVCDSAFNTKDDLKKHRKKMHTSQVQICEKFIAGKCIRNDSHCWYRHVEPTVKKNTQVFPQTQPQTIPPDQLRQMLNALEGLGSKLENVKQSFQNLML